jgi:hypothetical protein
LADGPAARRRCSAPILGFPVGHDGETEPPLRAYKTPLPFLPRAPKQPAAAGDLAVQLAAVLNQLLPVLLWYPLEPPSARVGLPKLPTRRSPCFRSRRRTATAELAPPPILRAR